jgi:molecular chaperone DnaJ
MARDYYDVLGVQKGADDAALKSAYRKKAMEFHPDRNADNPDAEAKFKEVSEAYTVLSDPQKRAAYDQYGHAGVSGMGGGGPQGFSGNFEDLGDVFGAMFGDVFGDMFSGRGRGGPARGADVRADIDISLEEAFHGVEVEVNVPVTLMCEVCDGSGAAAGTQPVTCKTCNGAGRVRASQGFFTMERTCHTCGGRGKTIEKPCKNCNGHGLVRKARKLNVKIPAGVDDGARIRLSGEGDAGGRGGPRGDVYVFVGVRPHSLFERHGPGLVLRAPVPVATAILGGEIEVPAIDGAKLKVKVPEGAQSGATVRLRGQGMNQLRARQRGDMLVELQVETPVSLSRKQKDLLAAFAEATADAHPRVADFQNRVKRYFEKAAKRG